MAKGHKVAAKAAEPAGDRQADGSSSGHDVVMTFLRPKGRYAA